MRLGIFARTLDAQGPEAVLAAVRAAGFEATQMNASCLGLAALPPAFPPALAAAVAAESARQGVAVAGLSATYNMIHPDPAVRARGRAGLEALAAAARSMGTGLLTLCTGSFDVDDQWRWHPDNATPAAWRALRAELEPVLAVAERHDVALGIEPEHANVVADARAARRLLDEVGSPRLRIVLDPANLFEQADARARRRLVEEAADLLGADLAMAHAKDRAADGRVVAPGRGVVDFGHFVRTLAAAGFDGPLVAHGLSEAEAPGVAAFLRERMP